MNLALRLANVLTFAGQLPPVVADSMAVGRQNTPLSIKSGSRLRTVAAQRLMNVKFPSLGNSHKEVVT